MNDPCGCCEGTEILTPMTTANRPGLPTLFYRVGTHATFLETMKARLSNLYLEIPEDALDDHGRRKSTRIYPLRDLKTRSADDPAIALLDSWAVVADVLTFYQERVANEGYLRTATERRSILELARLIGYALRPGVASTVYLAYTLDEDKSVTPPKPTEVTIPAGARVQSVPGPGELPQSFETSDDLEARSQWNNLQVRLSQPQTKPSILERKDQDPPGPRVYLKGISTNLQPNDPLLIDFGTGAPELFRVMALKADAAADRTCVSFRPWVGTQQSVMNVGEMARRFQDVDKFDVDATTAMGKRVLGLLQELEIKVTTASTTEVMDFLERIVLPELAKEHQLAKSNQFTKLEPWLGQMIDRLEGAREDLVRNVALEQPTAGDIGASVSAGLTRSATTAGAEEQDFLRGGILNALQIRPSIPPPSPTRLKRNLEASLSGKSDTSLNLLASLQPLLRDTLSTALAHAQVTQDTGIKVYAFRVKAAPFGNNAPKRMSIERESGKVTVIGEWPIIEWPTKAGEPVSTEGAIPHEDSDVIYLDASYEKVTADSALNPSWIMIDPGAWKNPKDLMPQVTPAKAQSPVITRIVEAQSDISRADYGITGKTTRIRLSNPWLTIVPKKQPDEDSLQTIYDLDYQALRSSAVYVQSEELPLAKEPIETDICDGKDDSIELNGLYSDLQSGRWLIVSGERTDIKNEEGVIVPGVKGSELVMLADVTQDVARPDGKTPLPGDKTHTFIQLAEKLSYCYKRDTATIYGNVVKATHGETRNEVLGSGDGSKALQQFTLKQPPLTFVSAPNPSGVDSTLKVRVNDVLWHETNSLAGLMPTDRKFITRTDDDAKTTIIFGNGQQGARLPTGLENVKAVYRNGIGKPGNVKAGQITLLATRPLGVKGVTNPIRASGGADKESRDLARQNAPLAVMALDRLVSTQDYADFARTFAGIGKASAIRLSDGRRQLVHVTIVGADDIAIDKTSDLYRNLVQALHDFGDPYLPIQVDVRELLALIISANVRVLQDYQWESVEPEIRATLLDKFGFQRRELGQTVFLSEVVSAIQRVAGVAYVDVDVLSTLSEVELSTPGLLKKKIDQLTAAARPESSVSVRLAETTAQTKEDRSTSMVVNGIYPAQLAFLTPDVPDTLILNEVTR